MKRLTSGKASAKEKFVFVVDPLHPYVRRVGQHDVEARIALGSPSTQNMPGKATGQKKGLLYEGEVRRFHTTGQQRAGAVYQDLCALG